MTNKTENPRQIDLFNSAVERMKLNGCDSYFDIVAALETDDDTYFLIRSKRKISAVDVFFEE